MQGRGWLNLRGIQRGKVVSQDIIKQLIKLFDPESDELGLPFDLIVLYFNIILSILSLLWTF